MRNPTASRKTASKKHVPLIAVPARISAPEHPLFNQAPGSSSPGPFHPSPPVMSSDISTNKKARRDYEILDTYECGMELKGTEVKSIRAGKVNIADSFARVENGQMLLVRLRHPAVGNCRRVLSAPVAPPAPPAAPQTGNFQTGTADLPKRLFPGRPQAVLEKRQGKTGTGPWQRQDPPRPAL